MTKKGIVHVHVGGLLPCYDTLHKLFSLTLFPKVGNSSFVCGYALNLLFHVSSTKKIDIMDFLYQEIRINIVDRRPLIFSPYVQALIDGVTKKTYFTRYSFNRHVTQQHAIEKHLKGVTKEDPQNKSTRVVEYMDVLGSLTFEAKKRDNKLLRGMKSLFSICKTILVMEHKNTQRTKLAIQTIKEDRHAHGIEVEARSEEIESEPKDIMDPFIEDEDSHPHPIDDDDEEDTDKDDGNEVF